MQIIDTNILMRMLLQDDPEQGKRVDRFVAATVGKGSVLSVPDLILAELFWALSHKGLAKEQILRAAIEILDNEVFKFDNHERAAMAVGIWAEHNVDFTDAYLAAKYTTDGADAVVSFDQDFKRLPVRWIQP